MAEFWMQTRSGKAFDFLDPKYKSIDIEDIAHALSMQCRFNGHTRVFYSTAEHCVRVAALVAEWEPNNLQLQLLALLHDAAEAYVGDVVQPLKLAMRNPLAPIASPYDRLEALAEQRVFEVLAGFSPSEREQAIIKRADLTLLVTEKRDLLGEGERDWNIDIKPLAERISPWTQPQAAKLFHATYANMKEAP